MADKLKAAVIGASGIGKHHAKWLNNLGCEVAAFAGTTPDSVKATADALEAEFGIEAAGYADVGDMLDEVRPAIVNICCPPAFHHRYFMMAADRGCHIMCEKPLTWDEQKTLDQLLFEAREMAEYDGSNVVYAVNTQYVAALPAYYALCEQVGAAAGPPEKFFMQLDSRHTNKRYDRVWVDIASHPLSMLMAFCGKGSIVPATEDVIVAEKEVRARFLYHPSAGPTCEAEIVVRAWRTDALVRRFGINDILVDYAGRNDENGVFCTYLSIEGEEAKSDDLMYVSLSRFVEAVRGGAAGPLADVEAGYMNQKLQFDLLKSGRRE